MNSVLLTVLATAMAPPVVLDAGPLKLEVHASASAQLFYIVDQMSGWGLYNHPQFRRRLGPFTAAEEELLQQHAAVRRARGYGVLDQTIYPATDWRDALEKAVESERLSRAEADTERAVLSHFTPRVMQFINANRPAVEAAIAQLGKHTAEIEAFARKAARFTGQAALRLPLYLVPSGDKGQGGGGASGGVLVVEVGDGGDPYFTLVHEAWHAFVEHQTDALNTAVKNTPGFDWILLSEGMAYVISPGLFHAGPDDELLKKVRSDIVEMSTNSDERFRRYAMFNRFALALRPLLVAALDDPDETLVRFLPRACDVFRALQSLNPALDKPGLRGIFLFGPHLDSLWERAIAQHVNLWGRRHEAKGYELLARAQPGDLVLLLFTAADLAAGVPVAWRDLLPTSLAQVKTSLDAGHPLEAEASRRQWKVILLAAPDETGLAALARRSKLLERALPAPAGSAPAAPTNP
jgi:hypothetical protein